MKTRSKISTLLHLVILALPFSANAGMGGISGGGGSTVPANPAGSYEIQSILEDARYSAYLFYATALRNDTLTNIGVKNLPQVLEVIKTNGIDINTKGPCFDNNGNPNDGSVNSSNPLYICISSKTLGKKLDEINAWAETVALVIHEYAHLVGATEDQAVQVQTKAISELIRNSAYKQSTESEFVDRFITYKSLIPRRNVFATAVDIRQISDFVDANRRHSAEELFTEMTFGQRAVSILSPTQLIQIVQTFPLWDNAVQISRCITMGSGCPNDQSLITRENLTLTYEALAAKLYAIYNDIQFDQYQLVFGRFIAIDGVPEN